MHIRQIAHSATPDVARHPRRLTLDHLWMIAVLALVWMFISVLPLPPNDLWWHMAAGRTMVEEGAWLQTNRWAYTLPADTPYIYQSWLSEVLLYWLWRIGDVPMLALTRTLVIVTSYGLVSWHAWRRSANGRAVALALFLAVLIGWNNWTLRPQTLALLPGSAFVVVLDSFVVRRLSPRLLGVLPLLMVLWVNIHGSFILGIVLLGLAWLGVTIEATGSTGEQRSIAWQRSWTLLLVLGATLLATMLHPLGFDIFAYVRSMLSNTPLQRFFVEWQPPAAQVDLLNTGFWFFLVLLGLAALMAVSRRRPSVTDLLWYCALGWLTIGGVRYAIWFALALLPLLAEQLAGMARARATSEAHRAFSRGVGVLIGAGLIATLPWFMPGRYLGPQAERLFANAGRYRMLLSSSTPIAATEWLAQHPIPGRFWVEQSYSSYTIWRLHEKQVFVDLRVELFPEAMWLDYFAIAHGDQRSLELLDRWQITHLMLDRRGQGTLHQLLTRTTGWCERYRDSASAIVARCGT